MSLVLVFFQKGAKRGGGGRKSIYKNRASGDKSVTHLHTIPRSKEDGLPNEEVRFPPFYQIAFLKILLSKLLLLKLLFINDKS